MTSTASRRRCGKSCVRISQLEAVVRSGGRIALWGWGREGRAAYSAIRARLPQLPLTLLCGSEEVSGAAAMSDAWLAIETEASAELLCSFELIVKSPGISPYRAEAATAAAQGTRFIGGTTLWFAEQADADGIAAGTVCITGTKGKSTSTALLAHLLRAGGHRTALAGNIGLPLLELPDSAGEFQAIELSSYQTGDVAASGVRPDIAVVTNIFPEHLDWHGSEARYVEDKLRLLTGAGPRIAVLNADDARLAGLSLPGSEVHWFGGEHGWHLRGDRLYRGDTAVMDTTTLPLPGRHNRGNLCAVLTAIDALGEQALLTESAGRIDETLRTLQRLQNACAGAERAGSAAECALRRARLFEEAKLELDSASRALEEAHALHPSLDAARAGVRLAQRREDASNEALWLERLVKLLPEAAQRAEAHLALAILFQGALAAPQEAEAAARAALAESPRLAAAETLLSTLLTHEGRIADLAAYFEEASATEA
ncbi:MAG: hypothetical protein KY442_09125, partial [Proteobacteria bacterium]|nr:hypothetical protein [Pseudomonadota bacterium]